jgi:signal transduction histidine kinase
VSVAAGAAEPTGLRVEVADQGPGIDPAERERVFQRFTRGATSEGGTGLGLAIARWAVELHSGTIEVMDAQAGCRITVIIPEPVTAEDLT